MKKTIKILTLIALILIFRPSECNHALENLYFVNQAINIPEGYKPIYFNFTVPIPGIIRNRNLKQKRRYL